MDEIILKWTTVLTVVLTVVVCIAVHLLPKIQKNEVIAAETYLEEVSVVETEENFVETAGVQPLVVEEPEKVVEVDETMPAQLKIELPEGVGQTDVVIENDYLTQTVYIHIPCDIKDYFSEYRVKGSCEHISTLSYYSSVDGAEGIIAIALNRVYELTETYEGGNLYLDFVDPHEIYDKVIVIDAGHGSRDSGATRDKIEEKNVNLGILLALKELLDECPKNIGVYYTRTSDTNPTLSQRVQLANLSDADLFLSVHSNATSSYNFSERSGTEVLYSESDTSELSSKNFAEICQKNVTALLGSKDLGVVAGDRIYIVRTSEVPVALIEVGYMTNREELQNLASEEYQKLAAQGLYNAILAAFEVGY